MHLGREGGNCGSVLSQKDAVPWGPISSQVGVSGCPVGLGAEGASSSRFCFVVQSFHHSNIRRRIVTRKSILPSRLSGTIRQQESKMVSIGRPTLPHGNSVTKTKVCLPIKRIDLRSMRVCTTCHNTTCRFQEVRESFSTNP